MKRALLPIVLLLLAAGVAPGAPALFGGNSPLGEQLLDAGSRHVASGLSAELQQGSDEVWLRRAAECFVAPKTKIKGTPDFPHEGPQAQRPGELQGGGEFEFHGHSSQGVEGVFRPSGQAGVEIPTSLKKFHDVDSMLSMMKEIRRNSNQAQAAGVANGLFYGEPTKFTAQQLVEFAQNGPLSKAIIKDGAFSKIILKGSDGVVEITATGVKSQ